MVPLIPHDQILRLHKVAVNAGLYRDALLAGIDREIVAGLHWGQSPVDQLLLDLSALNRINHHVDGDVPLRRWIKNALAMLGSRDVASIVSEVLGALNAKLNKKPHVTPSVVGRVLDPSWEAALRHARTRLLTPGDCLLDGSMWTKRLP